MRVICVDDEHLVLNLVVYLCEQLPEIDEVKGFTESKKALEWLQTNKADLAILDIDMPVIDGISLAIRIKREQPTVSVIFLTGYSKYAVEAFKMHAQGYLLKPVNKEMLQAEIRYAMSSKAVPKETKIYVKTFGEFEIFVDGKPVHFARSKSKELLAFLIDANGANVSRATAFSALYEDIFYDRKMQKQFDVIVRSLRESLNVSGAGEIFEIKSGMMRLNTDLFDCDLYRLLNGNVDAINEFRGEYMNAYSWANITEASITTKYGKE